MALLCSACMASTVSIRGLRGEGTGRFLVADEVEASLRDSLEAVLNQGSTEASKQLSSIEASIWKTYAALPKNDFGRLGPRAVRYLVHNYFAREHGWIITGLEPHGNQENVTEIHQVSILQNKAPAVVEMLLESQRGGRGLSLSDSVVMVAALERLIFDEAISLLQASYDLNGFDSNQAMEEESVHDVLTSYLMLFEMGQKANLTDTKTHRLLKARAAKMGGSWPMLVEFEQDAVMNFAYAGRHSTNPFVEKRFSFEETSNIVEDLTRGYGKWQNSECQQMKTDLMEMDPDGTGRIPLKTFYGQPQNSEYQFTESVDYLRQIGALDETASGGPRVRIANYLAGPSNCIASSTYYSVCCISECEILLNELESKIQAPSADPSRLLGLVSNMSSSTVDAPRDLGRLMDKLETIADRNAGQVPLHGRLFAQWLHHAFPNECPYPAITETAAALTPNHWTGKSVTAPEEIRKEVSQSSAEIDTFSTSEMPWTDEELLHAHDLPKSSGWSGWLRIAMQLTMVAGLLKVAVDSLQAAATGAMGPSDKRKASSAGFELPF
jgi:hypothetical protein